MIRPHSAKAGLTISVGTAVYDGHAGDSFEQLIERADRCLYEAKRMGRNRVVGPRPWRHPIPEDTSGLAVLTTSEEAASASELEDLCHLYGEDLAPAMAALTDALTPVITSLIDEFHQRLGVLADIGKLIRSLSESELYYLKRRQIRNLMMLASPDLNFVSHRDASLKMGRIYTLSGLSHRGLAHSLEILHEIVSVHVDTAIHHTALEILSRRLNRDLTWQIEASRRVWETAQGLLLRITELAWSAASHTDLIGMAATIIGELDGSVGCSIGRPTVDGVFRFESVSGERLKDYLAALEAADSRVIMKGEKPRGQGPTGRAWTGGQIERCINFETDRRMDPWRDIARQRGIRSCVAIPLCPPNRTPGTVLTLYGELPGGYTSPEQIGFISQVQALLTFAVARLEGISRTVHALPWSTRQRWANLIGTSALEMYYQPIWDLVSGSVTRAEALVRLRDGDEILAPGSFFPSLSREDFVVVYAQGLHQVLDQQNLWLREGFDILVSVNLPAEALGDDRYFEITRKALRRHGGRPQQLMLEVLETSDTFRADGGHQALEKFTALGIKLAEDDLGSGHSGLERLRALPFDVIKLDRSLLQGIEQTPIDVLSSIYQLTNLCHALGKTVVVEGVESVDLIDAVALLGADAVQGYAIARPMPATQFADWLRQQDRTCQTSDRMYAGGQLARLAKLLIWESHLRLLFGAARSRVYEFSTDDAPVLPFRSISPVLQLALLEAAMNQGVAGPEYLAAREKLIAALRAR